MNRANVMHPSLRLTSLTLLGLLVLCNNSCRSPLKRLVPHPRSRSLHNTASHSKPQATTVAVALPPPEPTDLDTPEMANYPWIRFAKAGRPLAQSTLLGRFVEPKDFTRVTTEPGSFAHWLRALPLAGTGTNVADENGKATVATTAGYAAAVVAIDMHAEESADALLRLHAEWLFSKGNLEGISYVSNSGKPLTFSRWRAGERIVLKKQNWEWLPTAKPATTVDYNSLRNFLDAAFQWVDPRALAIQGKATDAFDVEPGD